jgi:hypothetical protein
VCVDLEPRLLGEWGEMVKEKWRRLVCDEGVGDVPVQEPPNVQK